MRTELAVLADEPRLKDGEEERGGDASQEAAKHEHPKVGRELGEARDRVDDAKCQRHAFPAAVGVGAHTRGQVQCVSPPLG